MFISTKKFLMPTPKEALPGRSEEIQIGNRHFVNGNPLKPPFPDKEMALFGMGCFWGGERKFWQVDGVYSTAVGYSAGRTPNPTYQEVCSGLTGHVEVVRVVLNTESNLPGSLQWVDRARRGGAGGLRPPDYELRRIAACVLGKPRSNARNETGKRSGHPVSVGDLFLHSSPGSGGTRFSRTLPDSLGSSWTRRDH